MTRPILTSALAAVAVAGALAFGATPAQAQTYYDVPAVVSPTTAAPVYVNPVYPSTVVQPYYVPPVVYSYSYVPTYAYPGLSVGFYSRVGGYRAAGYYGRYYGGPRYYRYHR